MKTMKRTFLLTNILLLIVGIAFANTVTSASDIPSYYSSVDGLSGKTLFDQVHTVAKEGYDGLSYSDVWTAYQTTDLNSDGKIWDMYGGCEFTYKSNQCGNYKNECECYNREHSIPKSWFGGSESSGTPGTDIFHLVPTDGKVNGMRSNYAFGEVSSATYTYNGSKLGTGSTVSVSGNTIAGTDPSASCTSTVFEPIDEYKGDFARGYFGTLIRWANGDYQAFTTGDGAKIFSSTYTAAGYFGLTEYGVALLLKWHRQDPVSQKEIDRNNGIQQTQGNRNPFIDYPYLVEYIWGSHAGETVDLDELINSSDSRFTPGVSDGSSATSTTPTIIVNTTALTFANAEVGTAYTMIFTVKGSNITNDISLSLSGTNASLFSVSPNTISASSASNTSTITVTYTPTQIGAISATLTISSNGADDKTITITGTSSQTVTVTWLVNGEEYTEGKPTTSVVSGNKVSVLPTAPTSCSTESEQFVGWSASQIAGTTDQVPDDLFSDAQDAPVVEGDVTYYAVFAHVEETASTSGATKVQLTTSSTSGWTISGTSISNSYWKLTTGATITSPEIDLSLLESVVINARTYGGTDYKTITISNGTEELGSIDAKSSNLANFTWTPSSTLTGIGTLTFSSTTCTTKNGPGVGSITINLAGTSYTYSRFTTGCESEDTPTLVVSANSIAFGEVSKGETSTQTLTVKGTSLTSDITLSITGTDASLFSVSPAAISAAETNTTNTITVTYTPTTSGDFSATLQITSGTLSKDITLSGTCAEVCTVTWLVDGQEYTIGDPTTSIAINNQVTTLPTAPASCNTESEQFVGWSESAISTSQDNAPEDLFSVAADAPKVTKNTTYHAVFAHVEETTTTTQTYSYTVEDSIGWTLYNVYIHSYTDSETQVLIVSPYRVLQKGAYIESPEIDLSGLDSISVSMRTYGNKKYNTLTISVDDNQIGSVVTDEGTTMTKFQWVNTNTLSGQGKVKFYSSESGNKIGIGIGEITIYTTTQGTASYSRYTTSCSSEEPQALNVSTNAIAFGTIYEGETSTQTMTVTGTSLTSDITLSIIGTDASLFSVSPTTILAAEANTTNTITITYIPTTIGDFSATLHVVSGTLSQDITLSGSCPEVCAITWLVDDKEYTTGNPTTSIVINNQVTTLPTAPASCNNKSEQFVGWSETAISTAQDDAPDDLFSTAADAPIVLQSTIYRAVFAHFEETSASYSRYTTICESTTTEVEETFATPAAAEKIFLNGQMFIRYNGVVYDLFGQILYE